jgi:Fe(3+) dicitrate transport protein
VITSSLDDRLNETKHDAVVAALMPGAGAFYSLLPELGVLAGVYRGFSPPAPGEDNQPEYSTNYEVGARFTPKRARFELIGFFNNYSNMTDVCTMSSGCIDDKLDAQFNAGRAHIYGLEAFASYNLALGESYTLPLTASYTLTRAEFLQSFNSADPIYGAVKRGDEIPYVPRHQLNVTAALDSRWFGLNAALTYVSVMREVAGSAPYDKSRVTDDLFTLDVGGDVRVLPKLRIYANIRNLTDSVAIIGRLPYGARPNAPRWVQVGIKGTLD